MRVYRNASDCRKGSVGKVTAEVRAQVLRLHEAGKGDAEIGRLLGLDRKQVARALAHEGIKNGRATPASSRLPEILELRRQGVSVTKIGRRLGFGRSTIRRALQEARDSQAN